MGLFDRFKNQEARGQEFYCIVGLGNPGREYAETKHNVGFCVIDKLAEKYEIKVEKYKNRALIGDGMIRDKRVLLVKPQTFMNLSGESVREIVNFYKIPPGTALLSFSMIRACPAAVCGFAKRAAMADITASATSSTRWGRMCLIALRSALAKSQRAGIWRIMCLQKFSPDDLPAMEEGMEKAVKGVELILSRGVAEAANRVNQKPKSMKKQKALQEQAEKAEKETEKTTDGVNKE